MLSGPAVDRLKNSRVSEVIVTNTLPIEPERQFDKLTVLSIAPLLARAIKEVFEDGSVTACSTGTLSCASAQPGHVPFRLCAEGPARRRPGPAGTHPVAAPCGVAYPRRCPARELLLRDRRASALEVCRARSPARRPDPPLEEHITVADFRLEAETRTEFGKGSARRTRRAGRIPAVLYGHGQDVVHLSLPAREFAAALRNGGANALLTIVLDGKEQLALTKAVQRDPIKRTHEHVDLLLVRRGEKTTVEVPVVIVGEPAPDTIANHQLNTVSDRGRRHEAARAASRSTSPAAPPGENITAGDLALPAGATLITDPEALVIGFLGAPTAEALEAELAEAEAEAGIEREEPARPRRRRGRRRARAAGPGQRRVDGVRREVRRDD